MAYTGRPSSNRDIFSGFTEVITCKGFQNVKLYLAEFMKTAPAGYSVGHRA